MPVAFEEQVEQLHTLQRINAAALSKELGGMIVAAAETYDERSALQWERPIDPDSGYAQYFRTGLPVGAYDGSNVGRFGPDGTSHPDKAFWLRQYSITAIVPVAAPNSGFCCRPARLHLPTVTEVVETTLGSDEPAKSYDVYDPHSYGFPEHIGDIMRMYLIGLDALRVAGRLPDLDYTRTAIRRPTPPIET